MWETIRLLDEPPDPGDRPAAAVLAPLFEDESGELRTVLMKRPDTMPTHAGDIAFPGGRAGPGDKGPVDTALREAREEVGIAPSQVEVLGFLPLVDTVELGLVVAPVVGRVASPLNLSPSQREVAKVYTPLVSHLADADRWSSAPWGGWRIWRYDLDGDTLWGATARIVRLMVGLD